MDEQKILLVEDDFLNRRISKKVLIENGYVVFEAKNVKEAIQILAKETIDLAVLDINLGEHEENGISFGQTLNSQYTIPFIYLTAYENPEIINSAIATTPFSYLTKPFKNTDLVMSVGLALLQSAQKKKHQPTIVVKDEEYNINLPMNEINHIESDGNYLLIYTNEKVYKCRSTIKQMLDQLPESSFAQTHRAFIVNKNKIEKFTVKEVIVNNTLIPVSKKYYN